MQTDLCAGSLLLGCSKRVLILPLLRTILRTVDKALRTFEPSNDMEMPARPQNFINDQDMGCIRDTHLWSKGG